MEPDQALDDLRVIRQVMERTRRASGKHGGWYGILWGAIWFVGFLGNQFLSPQAAGWLWTISDSIGLVGSIWITVRAHRHATVHSPVWRPLFFWFLSLLAFDGLLTWLFDLQPGRDLALLILLTVALNFVQLGLFSSWKIGLIGVLIAVLAVGSITLFPTYFNLVMALLGGGLLAASGVWFIHQRE